MEKLKKSKMSSNSNGYSSYSISDIKSKKSFNPSGKSNYAVSPHIQRQ
jgi:hypothetical protein